MRIWQIFPFLSLIFCDSTWAIILSPTVIELNTSKGKVAQLVVTNNSTETLPLEVTIQHISFQTDGSFQLEPLIVDDELLVFPPAVMLTPGAKQVFRLQWVKFKPLVTSQSYFIRFSDANIRNSNHNQSTDQFTPDINVQIHYNALLHVYASKQKAYITMQISDSGTITLTNSGDKYTYSSLLKFVQLDQRGNESLKDSLTGYFLPPNTTITVAETLPFPAGIYHGQEQ